MRDRWKLLKQYSPLIRMGGNFGVSFFGSMQAFDFVTELPQADLIIGAFLTSTITMGLALSYEARRFNLGKKR